MQKSIGDVAKYHVVNGVPKVLYLFANQTKVDKGMVLRKAGYAGGEYRRQYEKQNPSLYPVIELCYTGERAGGKGDAVCTGYLMKKGRLQILYGSM